MQTQQYQNALVKHHIAFEVKNNGLHIIVEGTQGYIDVWPTTGKWGDRATAKQGFGLQALITHITGAEPKPALVMRTLKLSQTTVDWLRGVVQNPLWTSPENELECDSIARKEIWDAIQELPHE